MQRNVISSAPGCTNIHLERELLKAMAQPAPIRLLIQTAFEWLCVVALMLVATGSSSVVVSIGCMLLIATRQHALLALMHEYSHYQASRRHAWLNDLLGDVFTAFPFFITVHGFRRNHMPHHRNVSTEQDPDWISSLKKGRYHFPKTRNRILLEVLKHCIGWYTLQDLKGYTVDAGMAVNLPRATRVSRIVCLLVFAAAATYFSLWWIVLLYWIVPLSTFLMAILYLRDMGEHFGMPSPGIAGARTVLAGWIERLLICQNGVNFHTEHHLYPAVPFFRLGTLHAALMKNSTYRDNAVLTQGYFSGLIDEASAVTKP